MTATAATAAALFLVAAACSPGRPEEESDERSGQEQALAHAECMRDHGVDWPDPVYVDGEWRAQPGDAIDLESATYIAAETECQRFLNQAPAGAGGLDPGERAQLEEDLELMLEFASCMRDQGIDFPDPEMDDSGTISGPAGPLDGDWQAFDAARVVCEEQTGRQMP